MKETLQRHRIGILFLGVLAAEGFRVSLYNRSSVESTKADEPLTTPHTESGREGCSSGAVSSTVGALVLDEQTIFGAVIDIF